MTPKPASPERRRPAAHGGDGDDGTWLRAFGDDERRALGALFDRYAPRLLALYQHCLDDPADSEALLTQTFAQLHRSRRDYVEGTPLRTWLFGVAARAYLPPERSDSWPGRESAPPASSDSLDAADAVRAAINTLPRTERVLLYLHRFEGMGFGEIAQVLGSSTQDVRTRAVRAYGTLQRRLRPLVERGDTP